MSRRPLTPKEVVILFTVLISILVPLVLYVLSQAEQARLIFGIITPIP